MKSIHSLFLLFGDILSFIIGFFAFLFISFPVAQFQEALNQHLAPLAIVTILWIIVLYIFNMYELRSAKPTIVFLKKFGITFLVMLALGIGFFYLHPTTQVTPKTNLILFLGISLVFVLLIRRIYFSIAEQAVRLRIVIICADETHQSLADILKQPIHVGIVYQGSYPTLEEFYNHHRDTDIAILHTTANQESHLLEKLLASNAEVLSLAEGYETLVEKIPVQSITHEWIMYSVRKNDTVFAELFRRVLGILFGSIVLLVTLPLTIITALSIWIEDRGPLFYRQLRVGKNGVPFYLYKFRSMTVQAESAGAVWATVHDPRVTKVGAIIRKLHIDEIPQMINIIKGDLDIVGPRPERPEFVSVLEQQIPFYFIRHVIKPGFTGWAQIKFRYARTIEDSQEKFEYDLFYIKNRNIFLDIGIILKTAQIIFTHAGK